MRSSPLLASLLVLLACERGAEPPAAPTAQVGAGAAARDYFPMVAGARWEYSVGSDRLARTEVSVEGQGMREIRGLDAPVYVVTETARGGAMGTVDTSPVAYVVGDAFIARYMGIDFDGEDRLRMLGGEDPTWILPLAIESGRSWTQVTRMLELPESQGEGSKHRWTGRLEFPLAVKVPAGAFEDCVKVRAEYWDEAVTEDGPLMVYEDYYARGVGLVRSVSQDQRERGAPLEQELLRYEIPAPAPANANPGSDSEESAETPRNSS
jgi:hypothetical protein